MSDELKPCPFCGGPAQYTEHGSPPGDPNSMAECRQCGARAYWRKWNRRPREHRFGSPPEPVANPNEAWCERYADWYYQGKG